MASAFHCDTCDYNAVPYGGGMACPKCGTIFTSRMVEASIADLIRRYFTPAKPPRLVPNQTHFRPGPGQGEMWGEE